MNKEATTTENNVNVNLDKFILNINSKNYAEANKYLGKVIETKLAERILKASNQSLFNKNEQ